MICLTSLIKCKKNQILILLLQIQVRTVRNLINNIKTVTTNNLIISECQSAMRFHAIYSVDAFNLKSEMNKATIEAVDMLVNRR